MKKKLIKLSIGIDYKNIHFDNAILCDIKIAKDIEIKDLIKEGYRQLAYNMAITFSKELKRQNKLQNKLTIGSRNNF